MKKFALGLCVGALLLSSCSPKSTGRTISQTLPAQQDKSSSNTGAIEIPPEEADPVRPPSVQAEIDELRKTLNTIALDLSCSVAENCIALGADDNACGIPLEWLIFSTQAPRYIEVDALLRRSFYLDNTYPSSRIQKCGGPTKPKLGCTNGQCERVPFAP